MDTLTYLGNSTSLVEIGIVMLIAAVVMGTWQAIKARRGKAATRDAASVATAQDMRHLNEVRLEA